MEWIETTGPTIEAAKDSLLDQLGIDETEAEFEVLEEAKPGLFGKIRRPARVRARITPLAPRTKDERRRRPKQKSKTSSTASSSGGSSSSGSEDRQHDDPADDNDDDSANLKDSAGGGNGRSNRGNGQRRSQSEGRGRGPARETNREPAPIDEVETELVAFLTGLVDAAGLTAEVSSLVDDDGRLRLSIDGDGLGLLIGPSGGMLSVLHDLCRTRLHRCFADAEYPKITVDVGGYRALRAEALSRHVNEIAARVLETGEAHSLGVMGSGDRKTVHDLVGELDGVGSISEGEDPDRRVVIIAS